MNFLKVNRELLENADVLRKLYLKEIKYKRMMLMITSFIRKSLPLRMRLAKFTLGLLSPTLRDSTFSPATRPMLAYIKRTLKGELVGVELGVYRGVNSENILQNLPIKTLYAVDPYPTYWDLVDGKKVLVNHTDIKLEAQERFKKFSNVCFIPKTSEEAAAEIPDSLDFVYIDADHNYGPVLHDIKTYYPKVRPGGVIGGHDFEKKGVFKAVSEFVIANDLQINFEIIDWWVVKPKNL